MKCTEAKLRKSSIESVATRLCNEALSSMSADRQGPGAFTSPGRVSTVLNCSMNRIVYITTPPYFRSSFIPNPNFQLNSQINFIKNGSRKAKRGE